MAADPWYAPATRTAHVGGAQVGLTEREGEAFAYLCERLGQVVSRDELERDVWGMAPGVRSETVPVTLRAIRRKLGDHAVLNTVRGVGWRLEPAAGEAPSSLPRFDSAYTSRPAEEQALQKLLEGDWRVVTVVGPGGIGKTRLATELARRLEGPVVYASVEASPNPDAVREAILSAAGVNARSFESLLAAFGSEPFRVALDQAELAWESVREVVQQLPSVRFLVISRRELELQGEAVHLVRPFDEASGAAFLRSRLSASRWASPASDEDLQRAVRLLDGLPLALEVVATHPDPLPELLAVLERGELPSGPEGERLQAALTSSWERLDAPQQLLLSALATATTPTDDTQLTSWLGAEAVSGVRALASRSLVDRQDGGWVLGRTLRTFVRNRPADWDALTGARDEWLLARLDWAAEQVDREPITVGREVARLLPDLYGALERADTDALVPAIWQVARFLETYGPRLALSRVVDIAQRRLGVHPVTQIFDAFDSGPHSGSFDVPEDSHLLTRLAAETMRSDYARDTLDPDVLARMREALGDGDTSATVRIDCLRALALTSSDPASAKRILEALLPRLSDHVAHRPEVYRRLAGLYRTDLPRAIQLARRAVEDARQSGLSIVEYRCRWILSTLLAQQDPELGVEAYIESAERLASRAPTEADALRSAAGLLLYGLADDERALPLLEAGLAYPRANVRIPSRAALAAIALSRGDASDARFLRDADPRAFLIYRETGAHAGGDFLACLQAELALNEGRPLAEVQAELTARATPDDPVLVSLARQRILDRS